MPAVLQHYAAEAVNGNSAITSHGTPLFQVTSGC